MRRFAAIAYDSLLLFSVLFFGTLVVLALTGGRAITPGNTLYRGYLLVLSLLYFAWFWTHGGQTPGMRAWRLRLRGRDAGAVTWGQAVARFTAALVSWLAFGLGFAWALWDRERLTWHDRLSRTVLVLEGDAKTPGMGRRRWGRTSSLKMDKGG